MMQVSKGNLNRLQAVPGIRYLVVTGSHWSLPALRSLSVKGVVSAVGFTYRTAMTTILVSSFRLLICGRLPQWSVAIKDTIDEFVEAAKTAGLANAGNSAAGEEKNGLEEQFAAKVTVGGKDHGEEGGEGDAFDFDDMDEDYSAAELQCVEASIDILRVFRRCLKAANEAFNTLDSAPPEGVDAGTASAGSAGEGWLQGKLEWAKAIQVHLEQANECAGEVGILLYPPLDGGELLGRATDLERSLISFCDAFYAREEGDDDRKESPLRKAVEDKLGALRAAVEAL